MQHLFDAMISSLFAAIAQWFRGHGRAFSAFNRKRRFERFAASPAVEVLEARCLPSNTTVVPSLSEIPPLIAVMDTAFATQPKGNPTVVFVGDSISWQYAYGQGISVWATYMAPLGMANYGVSGQTTQSLLFQLTEGQLVGISPAVVVLDIGGNNLLQGDSPAETAAGVITNVVMIHQYQPQAQVLVLGVLPGMQSPSDPYRSEGAQTNQLVSQMLTSDPHATFLDFGSIFLQPNGTISTSMMFDYIHPTEQGYMDLTNVLLPVIEQYLFPSFSFPSVSIGVPASPPPSPLPSSAS
jgi:lysophospholipase L1-like esterase